MAYASTLRHVPVYLQTPNTCTTFFAPHRMRTLLCISHVSHSAHPWRFSGVREALPSRARRCSEAAE